MDQISYFRHCVSSLAAAAQTIAYSKIQSTDKVLANSNMILSAVLKAGFNHYSPSLEAEEIERLRFSTFDVQESIENYRSFSLKPSSRVYYELFSADWVNEDSSRTSLPFGLHQVQEEVLMPVIQNLMRKNRGERLKIYNDIKDQKIDYLNQWHKDIDNFYAIDRAEANSLIKSMGEAFAEYTRAFSTYKSLQDTLKSMKGSGSISDSEVMELNNTAEVVLGFEMQANECQKKKEELTAFMERIEEDIELKAAEFEYVEYYEASLRDKEARDMARSAGELANLDKRREKLLAINPYVARNAKLLPQPHIEQEFYDDFSINMNEYLVQPDDEGGDR
jgi:hypothetical protein